MVTKSASGPKERRPKVLGTHGPSRRVLVVLVALALIVGAAVPATTVLWPWWQDRHLDPVHSHLVAGRNHTCVLAAEATVSCWGDNEAGQLGTGTTDPGNSPVPVTGLTTVIALAAGGDHTCALDRAGKVWCWGDNAAGQLGTGSTQASPRPLQVAGLPRPAIAIATSSTHSCAVLDDRSLQCWGDNGTHALGRGEAAIDGRPGPVANLPSRVTAIAVGTGFTCVGFTGRTVRCWGDNSDGELGVGDLVTRARWEPVMGLPRTSVVVAGDTHACSLGVDGEVMCWGSNANGQLGIAREATHAAAPLAPIGAPDGITSVAVGSSQTCVVAVHGSVTCWGGQIDPMADPTAARSIEGVSEATEVAIGAFHACALVGSGVRCWGQNERGQLGDGGGPSSDQAIPVRR